MAWQPSRLILSLTEGCHAFLKEKIIHFIKYQIFL